MIHLDHRENRPIYAQVIERFKEQISAGALMSGDRLPSVRELAAELAINPNTIQRSYRQLEMEGWKRLLAEFDRTVDTLTAFGISRDTLIARLQRGGNTNA